MKLIMENWKNFVTEEEDTDNDGLADSDEVAAVDPQDPKSLILGIIMSRVQQLMQGEKMLTRVQTVFHAMPSAVLPTFLPRVSYESRIFKYNMVKLFCCLSKGICGSHFRRLSCCLIVCCIAWFLNVLRKHVLPLIKIHF